MQRMREVIRGSLARSLRTLGEEDRLAAAIPVVCGTALAAHCEVGRLDEARTLHLRVDAPEWLGSLLGMRERVQHELQRVAGVQLTGLHFVQGSSTPDRLRRSPHSGGPSVSTQDGPVGAETFGREGDPHDRKY